MRKLRVGVIGAGRIGRIHAANLAGRVPGAELAGVTDVSAEAARALSQELRIPAVADYRALLGSPDVDAVAVCSPTDTHARLIVEAARAGKHVFCEKPVDLDLGVIRGALDAVRKAGVTLQVGFNRRFDPGFAKAAALSAEGRLGAVHLVRITSRDPAPPPPEYVKVSGGIFLDMTIHDFDMARFLLKEEIVEVSAAGACLVDPAIGALGDVDTAVVTLRYASGAFCTIDNSRKAVYGYDQRVEVFGSKGCVSVGNETPTRAAVWDEAGLRSDNPLHFFLERYEQAYVGEMRAFVDCALAGKAPPVGGDDGLKAVVLGLAAKKSLALNRPVKVSEVADGVAA